MAPIQQAMPAFALQQVQRLGANTAGPLLGTAPNVILEPLNFTVNNLRPFDIQACVQTVLVELS